MIAIKVSEATYRQLDWLVAKCEGAKRIRFDGKFWQVYFGSTEAEEYLGNLNFTADPALMQPTMEREKIATRPWKGQWEATIWNEPATQNPTYGPTMLIAAARCYVASKLGAIVEVPEGLT